MKLKPVHHRAILLMAEGTTNKAIAEQLKVAPETVSSWKGDYDFKASLNKLLQANNAEMQDRLRHLSGIALTAIESVIIDPETPAKDRLTAALKVIEITQLETRDISVSDSKVLKAQAQEDNEMYKELYDLESLV